MRIVQVVTSFGVGGGETFTVALSEALLARGHDLRIVSIKSSGALTDRFSSRLASRTTVIGKSHRFDATVWPKLLARWATWQPDVIHTHMFMAFSWAGTAARVAGIPAWVHTQHSMLEGEDPSLTWLRRGLCLGLDGLVSCSHAVAEDVERRRIGIPERRHTITNGIPLAGRPTATPGLDGGLRLIAVGRLHPVKGHDLMLKAVAQLRAEGMDVELEICGEGELMDELQALVRELGIVDHVYFPGRVEDVAARLANADMFVMPSLSEGLPLASIEAAAAGLPLLVTTGGGAGSLIEAGAGGLVVEKNSVQALVDGVHALASQDLAALGRASQDVAMAGYSIEATAAAYEALYADILRRRG